VLRFEDSEVEPDLMVRRPAPGIDNAWERAPRPILIVEVFSDSTGRRDRIDKRRLYSDAAIEEYWMVDPEARAITVVRPATSDRLVTDMLEWNPRTASAPLVIQLSEIFGESRGLAQPASPVGLDWEVAPR
jgi:Uma2 family endonuclease